MDDKIVVAHFINGEKQAFPTTLTIDLEGLIGSLLGSDAKHFLNCNEEIIYICSKKESVVVFAEVRDKVPGRYNY